MVVGDDADLWLQHRHGCRVMRRWSSLPETVRARGLTVAAVSEDCHTTAVKVPMLGGNRQPCTAAPTCGEGAVQHSPGTELLTLISQLGGGGAVTELRRGGRTHGVDVQ